MARSSAAPGGRARRISVLVVDDHMVFADALQAHLAEADDISTVTVAYGVHEAVKRAGQSPVDVAVIDYMLGDGDGAGLTRALLQVAPATRVIVLSALDSPEAVVDALIAGIHGWLPKHIATRHLLRAIRGVRRGELWVDRTILGTAMPLLLDRLLRPPADPLDVLTDREREVLDLMAQGLNRTQIAAQLRVSGNTVRTHTQKVITKLGVHSSLEAVTLALRTESYVSGTRSVGRRR